MMEPEESADENFKSADDGFSLLVQVCYDSYFIPYQSVSQSIYCYMAALRLDYTVRQIIKTSFTL